MRLTTGAALAVATVTFTLTACGPKAPSGGAAAPAAVSGPSAADRAAIAETVVRAALIKAGDRVAVGGAVRDVDLLEDLAVATAKVGGQPLVMLASERLNRRLYDEVSATFDTLTPTLGLALVNSFDVQLSVDANESDSAMAGVPAARIAARSKAGQPVNAAFLRRAIRSVAIGNGLYPTASLARRLGVTQSELAATFWHGVRMAPDIIRARGAAALSALTGGRRVTITAPNGTDFSFTVDGAKANLSDGAIRPEQVRRGGGAAQTWLPAGELLVPPVAGTAEGKLVIDKLLYQGTEVVGLTLQFSRGRVTSMTATSGLAVIQAAYDAAGGAKDQFASIDLGLNPEITLPQTTGSIVYMAAGALCVGIGDNRFIGGTNVSDFGLYGAIGSATVSVDGRAIVENGVLK